MSVKKQAVWQTLALRREGELWACLYYKCSSPAGTSVGGESKIQLRELKKKLKKIIQVRKQTTS